VNWFWWGLCVLLVVVGGIDFKRTTTDAVGRLWWVRVGPRRTVEVWRRGFGLYIVINDQS
jgi:hypothetical protein